MTETATNCDGKTIRVGDRVGFKSDVEQYGIVTNITRTVHWLDGEQVVIEVKPADGRFEGDYLSGDLTDLDPKDCW